MSRPRKTAAERAELRRQREIESRIRELRFQRSNVGPLYIQHWGLPWCVGPTGEHHGGSGCEGCAVRAFITERTAELTAVIDAEIYALTNPTPEPLEGELFSLLDGKWVLA